MEDTSKFVYLIKRLLYVKYQVFKYGVWSQDFFNKTGLDTDATFGYYILLELVWYSDTV